MSSGVTQSSAAQAQSLRAGIADELLAEIRRQSGIEMTRQMVNGFDRSGPTFAEMYQLERAHLSRDVYPPFALNQWFWQQRQQLDQAENFLPDAMSMNFDLEPTETCWKLRDGIECGNAADPDGDTGMCTNCRTDIKAKYAR